jgi:hypothetical protein
MISLTLIVICILIPLGYTQVPNDGSSQIISDASQLSLDCKKILSPILAWTMFLYSSKPTNPMEMKDGDYRVYLKPFTTQKDTMEILQMPFLKNLMPTAIFDQEKNRGFRANLTHQQACDLYQHPNVCLISYPV